MKAQSESSWVKSERFLWPGRCILLKEIVRAILLSFLFFSGFEVVSFVSHILPALPSNKPMRNTLQAQSVIDWNL